MTIRNISALVACAATLAVSTSAMAQDTTRTRDSLSRLQMHSPAHMMTAQTRDSLITQLLDSANRAANQTIALQLRDSVATLRSLNLTSGSMNMRMDSDSSMNRQNMQQNMQMTPQQRAQQQNTQRQATSDQRLRVQKDWQNNSSRPL